MKSFKFKKFSWVDIIIILVILFIIIFWLSGGLGYIFVWYRQTQTQREQKENVFRNQQNQTTNDLIFLKNKAWNPALSRKSLKEEIIHFSSYSVYFCQFETESACLEKFIKENDLPVTDNSGVNIWNSMFDYFKSSSIKLPSYSKSNIIIRKPHFHQTLFYLYSYKGENHGNVDVYICIVKN